MQKSLAPNNLRHFLFTWMKQQNINDALLQSYSGHKTNQYVKIYSKLSLQESHKTYDKVISKLPLS